MRYEVITQINNRECRLKMDDTNIYIDGKSHYTIPIASITAIRLIPNGINVHTHICFNGGTIEIEGELKELADKVREINPSIIVTEDKPTSGAYVKEIIITILGFAFWGWLLSNC